MQVVHFEPFWSTLIYCMSSVPKMRLAKARKATKADFKLPSCVHAAEVEHDVTHELLEQCDAEARARAKQQPCGRMQLETFLESK